MCNQTTDMTMWDRLRLSPFQKWQKYRLIPWKFVLNILLIIASTTQIYLINTYITPFYRSQIENWQEYLSLDDLDYDDRFSTNVYWIYRTDKFVDSMNYTLIQYQNLNSTSVRTYEYFLNETGQIEPVTCKIKYYTERMNIFISHQKMSHAKTIQTFNISASDFGPFDKHKEDLQNFVHTLYSLSLTFRVKSTGKGSHTCWVNTVKQYYDFKDRGRVDMTVEPELSLCKE
eukprot:UN30072